MIIFFQNIHENKIEGKVIIIFNLKKYKYTNLKINFI